MDHRQEKVLKCKNKYNFYLSKCFTLIQKKKRKKGNILRLLSPISKTQREDASVKTRLGSIINKKARNDSAVNTQGPWGRQSRANLVNP